MADPKAQMIHVEKVGDGNDRWSGAQVVLVTATGKKASTVVSRFILRLFVVAPSQGRGDEAVTAKIEEAEDYATTLGRLLDIEVKEFEGL